METDLLDQLHAVGLGFVPAVVLAGVPRMLFEIDLDPYEHPRLGFTYARVTGRGDLGFEEVEKEVPPPLVFLREALYPLGETAESPAVVSQKLGEEELAKAGGLLGRVVGEFDEVPVEEGRAGDGAKTHAGSEDLGETIYPENAAVDVHGKEGGDERARELFEEALVRGVDILGTIKLEEVVWVWKPTGLNGAGAEKGWAYHLRG